MQADLQDRSISSEEYIVDDRDNAYDRFIKSKGRRLVFMEYVEL